MDSTCKHCHEIAIEVTRLAVVVDDMRHALLGNGQPGNCATHGSRIRALELWRSWMAGAIAALGLMFGWASAAVVHLLKR